MLSFSNAAAGGIEPSAIRLRVQSLGAGVQSTTLALMAAHGETGPMPDCAIFAEAGWEPKAVYDHLDWLRSPNVLPFPVHVVSAGNIRDQLMGAAKGKRWASIPAFAKNVTPVGSAVPVFDEDAAGALVEVSTRHNARHGFHRHDPASMHHGFQDCTDPAESQGACGADPEALARPSCCRAMDRNLVR